MMFKRKGEKVSYIFLDSDCIGRTCWSPGMYQHRAPMAGGGSRNAGGPDTPCCMWMAHNGCPDGPVGERIEADPIYGKVRVCGVPVFNPDLSRERKAEGWRKG